MLALLNWFKLAYCTDVFGPIFGTDIIKFKKRKKNENLKIFAATTPPLPRHYYVKNLKRQRLLGAQGISNLPTWGELKPLAEQEFSVHPMQANLKSPRHLVAHAML